MDHAKRPRMDDNKQARIRSMRRASFESWEELKQEMRERFMSSYYKRDLFKMYQGSRNVEEYFKETEVMTIKAQIFESQKATMARFLHGLNRDIQGIMELYDYTSLTTLVHQASKVETQLKRHGRKSCPTIHSNWKGKDKKEKKLLRREKSPKKGRASFNCHHVEVCKVTIPNSNI
ncbi:hypothetical protein CR513_19523, partial [Mucuna pruriens]